MLPDLYVDPVQRLPSHPLPHQIVKTRQLRRVGFPARVLFDTNSRQAGIRYTAEVESSTLKLARLRGVAVAAVVAPEKRRANATPGKRGGMAIDEGGVASHRSVAATAIPKSKGNPNPRQRPCAV